MMRRRAVARRGAPLLRGAVVGGAAYAVTSCRTGAAKTAFPLPSFVTAYESMNDPPEGGVATTYPVPLLSTPFVGTGVNASVESSNWRGPGRSPTWNVPPFGHPVPAGGLLIHKTSDPMYPGAKMFEPIIQKALESPSFG